MRRVGDRAALLELPDNASVHAAARLARERLGESLADVVPGHRTVLLVWSDGSVIPDMSELGLEQARPEMCDDEAGSPQAISIPTRYDGADLQAIAASLGASSEAVVELHSGAEYTVAFMGFAPGFPYLIGLPPELELPRLATPRTQVPAGSVAVAAGYCGIYPRSSPGGWNLLGRTDVVLFDAEQSPPALLAPGTRVRFEPV